MRYSETFTDRLEASLAATSAGWVGGNLFMLSLALPLAPDFNWKFWISASLIFSMAGWMIFGLPLAYSGMAFPVRRRRLMGMLAAGVAGILVIVAAAGPWLMDSPEQAWRFIAVASPQAMLTGAFSMFCYHRFRALIVGTEQHIEAAEDA